jgi:hypothetical protein
MPFDPPIDATDPRSWWQNRSPVGFINQPFAPQNAASSNRPLSEGIDDWFVPGNAGTDTSHPDDWIYPNGSIGSVHSAAPNLPAWSSPQPNATDARLPNPPRPNPFAAFWSLFPASRVGAMAWDPPFFPNSPGQFPLPAPAPMAAPPLAAKNGLLDAIRNSWAASIGTPTSQLGLLGALAASADASPPRLGLLGALMSGLSDGSPSPLGEPEGSTVPGPPSQSVSFNRSPALPEERPPDSDSGNLDQIAKIFGSELPLSKSGAPLAWTPPFLPEFARPSLSSEPWLDLARLVAPNIVDFYAKPLPPAPPFPSTPGKIPSSDNPYGPAALFEAATFLLPIARGAKAATSGVEALGRVADEVAPGTIARVGSRALLRLDPSVLQSLNAALVRGGQQETVARIAGEAVGPPAAPILDHATRLRLNSMLSPRAQEVLARIVGDAGPATAAKIIEAGAAARASAASQPTIGLYKHLSGNLPTGMQAHHFNQNTVFDLNIPRGDGLSVGLEGNVFTQPRSQHSITHQSLDQSFWDLYRKGGSLQSQMPLNMEYGAAAQQALVDGRGASEEQAAEIAARAEVQRVIFGFNPMDPVPRIPEPIFRGRR